MKKAEYFLNDYRKKRNPDDIIDQLLEDPVIRRFVMQNDLTHEAITTSINTFLTFKESKTICQGCNGLYECKMDSPGMTPILRFYESGILLDYKKCRYNMTDESKLKIDAMYVPRKVFNAELSDVDLLGNERKAIHQYVIKFLKEYSIKTPMKGMYLSGIFGAGKTYILAAVAN
ncbi:MAG: hypothetical protein PHP65_03245, partial [Bacilli bacterium]|nr:hypothetical protein [Bacilli bacterium]